MKETSESSTIFAGCQPGGVAALDRYGLAVSLVTSRLDSADTSEKSPQLESAAFPASQRCCSKGELSSTL